MVPISATSLIVHTTLLVVVITAGRFYQPILAFTVYVGLVLAIHILNFS